MVSSDEVEQHQDEGGTFHSFAHPHLLRGLEGEDGWDDIEPDFDDYTFSSRDTVTQAGLDLDAENGEEFNDEIVDYWSAEQPGTMDETFGFVSTHKEWERVSEAVRVKAPDAAHALETAEDLRREANRSFEADVDHMQTDEWKKDHARARAGL